MKKYGFNVFWSEEDQGFIATCPDFHGLSAFGETAEEALSEANLALEGFCESYVEHKKDLPEVTSQPECSGQIRLRMPVSLHQSLTLNAQREGVSLNQYMVYLLSGGVSTQSLIGLLDEHLGKIKRTVDTSNHAIKTALITLSVIKKVPEEYLVSSRGESHEKSTISIN